MRTSVLKLVAFGVALAVGVSAVAVILLQDESIVVLKVYTAGSLAEPFAGMADGNDLEAEFESAHPGVDVQVTSGGSVDMVRRVTGLNQTCDVLAVADYSLIPSMMINATPKTADFCIEFARNSMALAYTSESAYSEEINADNWATVLRRPDVKFGFSNPNDDPCGYRTQMVMILAQMHHGDPTIYQDLVLDNTNIIGVDHDGLNETYTVNVPSSLEVTNTDRLMVRSAEVDLTNALELGSIDYLFIYQSVAFRHASSGERYLELPREINLNDTAFSSLYSKVRVKQFADSTNLSKVKTVKGSPIVYGLTIPHNAAHPDLAAEFIRLVLGETGQGIMTSAGQEPIVPGHAGYWLSAVPEELIDLVH